MALSMRPKVYSLPAYSLTGDLISYLRCGLQYRYTRIGRLPSSHPLQLWFGEFIHGVLEEAYRRYLDTVRAGAADLPPWSEDVLREIRDLIKSRLAARNLVSWDPDLEGLGDARANVAIQELGPYLFPLIHRAEVRLTGARLLPEIPEKWRFREADRYEMVGVVDVVTHVELEEPKFASNPIVQIVLSGLPTHPGDRFEVIIDYKGMRRPPLDRGSNKPGLWTQYEWQLLTYSELRRRQADALPVAAGVLLYVNELYPTKGDIETLRREIKGGVTDVVPDQDSDLERDILKWSLRSGTPPPHLPLSFRLARALRVIPVSDVAIQKAVAEFDKVVERIETCRGREFAGFAVRDAWDRNPAEEGTCVVCDARTYCPDFIREYGRKTKELSPRLPGVKARS